MTVPPPPDLWDGSDDALPTPASSGRSWLVMVAAVVLVVAGAVVWAVSNDAEQSVLDSLGIEIAVPDGWVDVSDDLEDNPLVDEFPELRFDEWRALRADGELGTPIAHFTARRGEEADPVIALDAWVDTIFGGRDDVVETDRGTFDVEGGTGAWVIHDSEDFGLVTFEVSAVISWEHTGVRVSVVGHGTGWDRWDELLEALQGARATP